MISTIRPEERLKCLGCKKKFKVERILFSADMEREIISSPHCKKAFDVQAYHLHGEKEADNG